MLFFFLPNSNSKSFFRKPASPTCKTVMAPLFFCVKHSLLFWVMFYHSSCGRRLNQPCWFPHTFSEAEHRQRAAGLDYVWISFPSLAPFGSCLQTATGLMFWNTFGWERRGAGRVAPLILVYFVCMRGAWTDCQKSSKGFSHPMVKSCWLVAFNFCRLFVNFATLFLLLFHFQLLVSCSFSSSAGLWHWVMALVPLEWKIKTRWIFLWALIMVVFPSLCDTY